MRAFIAIPLPETVRSHAAALQKQLRAAGRGSFPGLENLHLTLAFLGEISAEQAEAAASILQKTPLPEMHLCTGEVSRFANRDGGTVYLAVDSDPILPAYRAGLCRRLEEAGMTVDPRPFRPHITLARRAQLPPGRFIAERLPFEAEEAVLFGSIQADGRRIYRAIARVQAQKDIDSTACDANNFHEEAR